MDKVELMPGAALRRRIRLGEDATLELKRVVVAGKRVKAPNRSDVADELAAMANSAGGTLVLGMDDRSREILGIPLADLDIVEHWSHEICNDLIKPPLEALIRKMELEDAEGRLAPIFVLDVARSLFVHKAPGGYFLRIGSSKREMAPDALARLFQQRSQSRVIRYDESLVPGTTRNALDYALTQRFLRTDAVDAPNAATIAGDAVNLRLRKLRPTAEDSEEVERLTLSAVLLCTREPQRWLPHAYIQAVSYARERHDAAYQTDARDIGGPLDQQVVEALHFVRRNMLVRAAKMTARTERPQFNERALFEALVNAVAHRDYSIAGARVRLHLFSDRLELHVPGALANTMSPDSLHLRQANRNELIVSLLARCAAPSGLGRTRLMDRRGDGVPIIRRECKALSGRYPEYSLIDESELRLVIWAA